MKTTTMTALAALMIATGGPALAQERGEGARERGERPRREQSWQRNYGERPAIEAPVAPQAPTAQEAPTAAEAPRPPGGREWRRQGERRGDALGRPGRWVERDGDDRETVSPADRADQEDRDEAREFRRWRRDGPRPDGDQTRSQERRGWEDRSEERRGREWESRRWDGDRDRGGDWSRRWSPEDRKRWEDRDRDRDRRRAGRPLWRPGVHPFSYYSQRRYRGSIWIAPPGFQVRSWRYGDHLPWGWYGANYRINDWFAYGLPWPPPGYDWVRVGYDVVLVDRFSGRVVQVVRGLFW